MHLRRDSVVSSIFDQISYSTITMAVSIYTDSPITPAKASGVTPQTAIQHQSPTTQATNPKASSVSSNSDYPPSRPGAVPTLPTPTQTPNSRHEPPPPQPGAFPSASTAAISAKPSVPPPPRVGEVLKPPEYYSPQYASTQSPKPAQPYPPQMMLSTTEPSRGQPPGSVTSTNTFTPAFTPPTSLPSPERFRPTPTSTLPGNDHSGQARAPLDHPPGYRQNPYATNDQIPDQRFAPEQNSPRRGPPGLGGYNNDSRNTASGYEDEESVWGMAKKWAKGAGDTVGSYVTDMNEKISRNLDGGK